MPAPRLLLGDRAITVEGTLVMGVVNASPESFSDAGQYGDLERQLARASEVATQGADIIDIGGQSAITGQPEIRDVEESRRVVPIVEWIRDQHPTALISVDTYKPLVVKDALRAGADIINDVSGLLYPEVAGLCAAAGAGLVVMHTKARPKQRYQDPHGYSDVVPEVLDFLKHTIDEAESCGLPRESIIVDPGPDFAKTPYQTIAILRRIDEFRAFGRPLLLALSRKDFLGAIVGRPPLGRDAATTAAIAHLTAGPGNIVRVHDTRAAVDAIKTVEVLTGRADIDENFRLPDSLRHQPRARSTLQP